MATLSNTRKIGTKRVLPFRLCLAACMAAVLLNATAQAADITVFAASSLTDALKDIAASYEKSSNDHIVLSLAASSTLAKQIESSAGADLYLSADREWMDYLDKKGLIDRSTRKDLVGNSLVFIAPAGSPATIKVSNRFPLLEELHGGRLAMAEPDNVPAGTYARAALMALGVWPSVKDHIAAAENVRVALSYVARGETPLGIVYKTDAISERRVRIAGTFPDNTHEPIVYPVALTKDAKPAARSFWNYLFGAQAQRVFALAGFKILENRR